MALYESTFCNALSEVLRNIYYTKKQKVSQRGEIINRISNYSPNLRLKLHCYTNL